MMFFSLDMVIQYLVDKCLLRFFNSNLSIIKYPYPLRFLISISNIRSISAMSL